MKKNGLVYNPYSFKTQLKFLQTRLKQEIQSMNEETEESAKGTVIVDRSIFEDCSVFAKSQLISGLMKEEEFARYRQYFEEAFGVIRFPDLVIYLKIDSKKLYERIQKITKPS